MTTQQDPTRLYRVRLLWDRPGRWGVVETSEPFPGEWIGVTLDFATSARNAGAELDRLLLQQAKRAGAPPKQCRLVVRDSDGDRFTWQLP